MYILHWRGGGKGTVTEVKGFILLPGKCRPFLQAVVAFWVPSVLHVWALSLHLSVHIATPRNPVTAGQLSEFYPQDLQMEVLLKE